MKNKEIILLLDYMNRFLSKSSDIDHAIDNNQLANYFDQLGWKLIFKRFSDIDFINNNYENKFTLYCSSEDAGLHYKDYIEDILLGLEMQKSILIPRFRYFRAHMNKVFCEVIRDTMNFQLMNNMKSEYYGTYEEYADKSTNYGNKETVLKVPDESCGTGVFLCDCQKGRDSIVKTISQTFPTKIKRIKGFIKKYVNLERHPYVFESYHRKKFIIQSFVQGLKDDWKVLIYNDRYYVLNRKIRGNDFRASGSHIFDFKRDPPEGLLEFSKRLYEEFDVPYASFDICVDKESYYLIEFQFVSFGTTTVEESTRYFVKEDGEWRSVASQSIVEEEMAKSIVAWINRKYDK